jgi:hypothetical protein
MALPVVMSDVRLRIAPEFSGNGRAQQLTDELRQTNHIVYGNADLLAQAHPQVTLQILGVVVCLCRMLEVAGDRPVPLVTRETADRHEQELSAGGREYLMALYKRMAEEQPEIGALVSGFMREATAPGDKVAIASAAITAFRLLEIQYESQG